MAVQPGRCLGRPRQHTSRLNRRQAGPGWLSSSSRGQPRKHYSSTPSRPSGAGRPGHGGRQAGS
ncbi:hypothetical protein E2562_016585 [Oryza meyeriana var. granulata]|uniref:Uncharacterized protein n=1 Tax=Oryza meyeriana var. granulata TaxID=110450 RepID=A0A6G1C798_9ORYZ|nr:hypothetical protein E2562_016585 [Oryza meyeriana var. granulata]